MWASLCQLLFPVKTLDSNVNKISRLTTTLSSQPAVTRNVMTPYAEEIRVDMADMKVEHRQVSLVTNVGSCVALCIHDRVNKCGGLAHIMLPSSHIARNDVLPSKYADTAVPTLVEAIQEVGTSSPCLSAKIAGGANMFPTLTSDVLNIGVKNIEAVKEALTLNGVKLLAEDIMGTYGRRVTFDVVTGAVCVRTGNGEVKEL